MFKQELEQRLGYEITQDGWVELNKMYMASELNKDAFAMLVKDGAKVYEIKTKKSVVNTKKEITYKGIKIVYKDYADVWYIDDIVIGLSRGNWHDSLDDAKRIIDDVMCGYGLARL